MKIGLLINPRAGKGGEFAKQVGVRVAKQLRGKASVILVGPREMGEHSAQEAGVPYEVVGTDATKSYRDSEETAKEMVASGADLIVVLGGDGTLARVATAIHTINPPPLIGVATGTFDVGALVSVRAKDVARLDLSKGKVVTVSALSASVNGIRLGLAFNDIVIGTTVPEEVGGKAVDIDAVAKMRGDNVPAEPLAVGTERAAVKVKRAWGEVVDVASGVHVGQVAAGIVDSRFIGKVVAGGTCLAALVGLPAALVVTNVPIVRVAIDATQLARVEPITVRTVSLGSGDVATISGMREGAVLCTDGEPLKLLTPSDEVHISVLPRAIKVVRFD